jgi:protein phosphatase
MGGHQAGDVASRTLVGTMDGMFQSTAYQEYVAYSPQHPDYYIVVVKEVLEQANERLRDLSAGHTELNDMGTTATVALIAGGRLFWGHIGDSRAYLLRDRDLKQLTRDHTWVAEQVEAGRMSLEDASNHPQRNVLTQSMGSSLTIRVERGMQALEPGDMLLLCSDGLNSVVRDSEIQQVLLAAANPQAACDQLVAMANKRGGPDNITVVVAQWMGENLGSNIVGGRVLGPANRRSVPQPVADTPTLKQARRRRARTVGRWGRLFGILLVLILGALLSGIGALSAEHISSLGTVDPVPMTMVFAVGAFALGALLGWLMRGNSAR